MPHANKARNFVLVIAMCLPTVLSSCLTTAVWGGSIEQKAAGSSSISAGGGPTFSDNLLVKILATPFAVVLDICTYPVQAALYGWDDEDEDCVN